MTSARPRLAWLELAVGLVVAGAGIAHTLWALPSELSELRPAAHHGVALIGCLIVLRAIAEIGANFQWAGGFGEHVAHEGWARFRAVVTGPRVEATVGALVVLAGFAEAYQIAAVGGGQVYHWGLVLVGLMMFCRAGFGLVDGLERLEHAGVVHRAPWLRTVARWVRHPAAVIGLAAALFALAGAEALLPDPPPPAEGGDAGAPLAPHGMAMIAVLHLMRACFDLGRGLQLVWATTHAPHGTPAAGGVGVPFDAEPGT